ncbi:MAG: HlyD family type I secretion periplasmic adaptor subunit [Paracoccaceae bacterium]
MTDLSVHSPALPSLTPAPRTGFSGAGRLGAVLGLAALAALGVWAATTMIGGAVIAQGEAAVRGQPRSLQHLDGGILSEILVANGDTVQAGQVIARLDPTLLAANLEIARSRLAGSLALAARLEAETAGEDRLDPARIAALSGADLADPQDLAHQVEAQAGILATRRDFHAGEAAQLQENLARLDAQSQGIHALIEARTDQLALVERELANLEPLANKGLIRDTQLLDAQRRQSELKGQIASDQADIARMAVERRDAELKLAQSRHEEAEKVATDLRTARAEAAELVPQILTTQAQLDRVEIRAPVAGIVHELQLTTPGAVLAAGQTLAQIVPVAEGVEFDLRLDPRSIDEVHPGQKARIVLPAFDSRTTPQIFGEVASISPTSVTDPQTGRSFYRLRLSVPADEMARLGTRHLVPGMPVEAYLQTGDRSVLAYLLHPLTVQADRMFRED